MINIYINNVTDPLKKYAWILWIILILSIVLGLLDTTTYKITESSFYFDSTSLPLAIAIISLSIALLAICSNFIMYFNYMQYINKIGNSCIIISLSIFIFRLCMSLLETGKINASYASLLSFIILGIGIVCIVSDRVIERGKPNLLNQK